MGVSGTILKRRKQRVVFFSCHYVQLRHCVLGMFGLVKYLLVLGVGHGVANGTQIQPWLVQMLTVEASEHHIYPDLHGMVFLPSKFWIYHSS